MNRMIGYVYCVTNNITKENYIGRHNYKKEDWMYYMGSGRLIIEAIDKYGKTNFSKILIEECLTIKELMDREEYWLNQYKIKGKAEYNISMSGGVSSLGNYWPYLDKKLSIEVSRKLSNSLKNSIKHKESLAAVREVKSKEKEQERQLIIEKHKYEVMSLYDKEYTMKNISIELNIPANLVRRILIENNHVEFDGNGHITRKQSEKTKRKISNSLTDYSIKNGITKYDYELLNKNETKVEMKKLYDEGLSLVEIGRIYNARGDRVAKIIRDFKQ